MIDWGTARAVGGLLAGSPPEGELPADLGERALEYQQRISDYTQLVPQAPVPPLEGVDRNEWIAANLSSMRPLLEPLGERLGDGAGPLGGAMRSAAGLIIGAQAGAMVGLLSQRVLGQYDLVLLDGEAPTRLLLVTPNLTEITAGGGVEGDELARWVAIHELTHAVQFTSIPWLRGHLAGIVSSLMSDLTVQMQPGAILRNGGANLRALAAAARKGELLRVALGPERQVQVDSIQATMSLIEGHAEHVMDAVGGELLPTLPQLRATMDERRATRSSAWRLIERLMGLDLKLRQYAEGRRFVDAVVARGGVAALNRAFAAASELPSPAELADPDQWLLRTEHKNLLKDV